MRLVKVETVEVKSHGETPKSCKPNSNHRPSSKEKVQATAVVERSVLENKTTKVTVGSHDVVRFFFLSELVAIVLAHFFSRLTDERACDQTSVHSTEESSAKHTSDAQHVERDA